MEYKKKKAGDLKLKHVGRTIITGSDSYIPTEGKLISVTQGDERRLDLKILVGMYGGHHYAYETVTLNEIILLGDKE